MFGSTALEVAIGLAFLFFILSLMATATREILEGLLQSRAAHLERGIRELLRDTDPATIKSDADTGAPNSVTANLYNHPLISGLYRGSFLGGTKINNKFWLRRMFNRTGSRLPAYIPARSFALALLDLSARGPAEAGASAGDTAALDVQRIRAGLETHIESPQVRRSVLLALDQAKGDLEQARLNLENWFDSAMDRVSGWYRKTTQWILLAIGLIVAMGLNIDTIKVASFLYQSDAERGAIVAEAEALVQRAGQSPADAGRLWAELGCPPPAGQAGAASAPGTAGVAGTPAAAAAAGQGQAAPQRDRQADISCAQHRIRQLGYPIGWTDERIVWPNEKGFGSAVHNWLRRVPGWLVTALAITLGAPFWFDILNKIMVIRSTVKPHEKSPEEASEDRQARPAPVVAAAPAPVTDGAGQGGRAQVPLAVGADDRDFEPHRWSESAEPEEGDL